MHRRDCGYAVSLLLVCLSTCSAALHVATSSAKESAEGHVERCVAKYSDKLDKVQAGLGDRLRSHKWKTEAVSYRTIIWGTGFGTTATRSLEAVLLEMGLNVWHWNTDPWITEFVHSLSVLHPSKCHEAVETRLRKLPLEVEAFIDTPAAEVFLTAYSMFPNAKFVHTNRDAAVWAEQRKEGHEKAFAPMQEPCLKKRVGDFSEKQLKAMFEAHNDLVHCVIPKERLVEVDLFDDSAQKKRNVTAKIADFMHLPPDRASEDFPIIASGEPIKLYLVQTADTTRACSVSLEEVLRHSEDGVLRTLHKHNFDHLYRKYGLLNRELKKYDCRLFMKKPETLALDLPPDFEFIEWPGTVISERV